MLAGRRPDCGRRRARTRGRRNKSKVWTRKTHDALRAAGFRAAQLRDRLEWVDAQRRSGREHGEEARQRSHRKGTSRWATAAAGCRPSSNSQIRRTRLLDPGGLIARRMSASNTRLRIKEALVPSTKTPRRPGLTARLCTRSAVPRSPGERERVASGPGPEPTRCRPPRRPPPRRELTSRELDAPARRPEMVDQSGRRCSFGAARRRAARHDREMVLTSGEGGRRRRMAS